ncbi:MAG TPA: rhodanese-like domain-containing protein [Longimicrobiales bacterium]|nr:rhodanese-like domain-containing protein [Longimicrobiales bacterium]
MIVKRFYDDKLAQASYLVGCAATGEALVVDPARDADPYIRAAEREGLEITHVTETHIHADFVSGSRELAERTGARLYLSSEGGPDWQYAYAGESDAVLLRDGDTFQVGNITIRALHTPGHTPEHLSFAVTDDAAADEPMGVFTGDFIFVGDVGRPDLLERAANLAGTMEAGARTLFASIQRFRDELPDWVQIWPGHGAGSACGKALGAVPQSTLGYEKRFNWGLSFENEEDFVTAVLAGQPEPPRYFAEMKRVNREGPAVLGGVPRPPRLSETRLAELLDDGALIIDTRQAPDFAAGHVPGSINIPLNRSFNTWAGWLTPYDRDFYLIVEDDCADCVHEAVRDLAFIGLDRVAGWFGADVVEAWRDRVGPLEQVPTVGVDTLAERLRAGAVRVLDVRGLTEWEAGHLPDAEHIPLGYLQDRLDTLSPDETLVVHCESGGRSPIAASLLRARGFRDVLDFPAGFAGWQAAGRPVTRGAEEPMAEVA